jgi:hypothetical protein
MMDKPTFTVKFQELLWRNPTTLRVVRSAEEVNSLNMQTVMSAGTRTFANYDETMLAYIEECLSLGKEVAINAAGPQKVMVIAGKGLFRKPGEQLEQDKVHTVMDALEGLRKRYRDDEGRDLLTGGLDSWIYPEKYVAMAQKYGFAKHKTFSASDHSLITEVESFLKRNKIVVVAAWEERVEVYLEPDYPSRTVEPSAKSTGCFVATAACGPGAPELQVLYTFRDDVLLVCRVGRWFLRLYYSVSPPIAAMIARSTMLRRAALWLIVKPAIRFCRSYASKGQDL